ncbi:MAG: TIGR03564 family F420-dependent LLM class oxidoreductase [Myxococcota bacterium]
MKIAVMSSAGTGPAGTLDATVAEAQRAEAAGLSGFWMPNIFGLDAINALSIVGRETERCELTTAVVPTYPRHPTAMAQQALTAAAACGGRFVLGIGLSHKIVIEDMLGFSYEKPARHMREYLEVLGPLLRGEPVSYQGEQYRVNAGLQVAGAGSVPILVAALGPVMLKLAGRLADGTITWMTGPKTLESHVIPEIRAAAQAAGRPEPRIAAGLPIGITRDSAAAREEIGKSLAIYGTLPSYRAMLDREGVEGPGDVALVGDEKEVGAQMDRLRDLGVTEFGGAIVTVEEGGAERTFEFLASRL